MNTNEDNHPLIGEIVVLFYCDDIPLGTGKQYKQLDPVFIFWNEVMRWRDVFSKFVGYVMVCNLIP